MASRNNVKNSRSRPRKQNIYSAQIAQPSTASYHDVPTVSQSYQAQADVNSQPQHSTMTVLANDGFHDDDPVRTPSAHGELATEERGKFLYRLYQAIEDPMMSDYIEWYDGDDNLPGFRIPNLDNFAKYVLPKWFPSERHSRGIKRESFIKQLSNYGFVKENWSKDEGRWTHWSGAFRRGNLDGLPRVCKKTDAPSPQHLAQSLPAQHPLSLLAQDPNQSLLDQLVKQVNQCQLTDNYRYQQITALENELNAQKRELHKVVQDYDTLKQGYVTLERRCIELETRLEDIYKLGFLPLTSKTCQSEGSSSNLQSRASVTACFRNYSTVSDLQSRGTASDYESQTGLSSNGESQWPGYQGTNATSSQPTTNYPHLLHHRSLQHQGEASSASSASLSFSLGGAHAPARPPVTIDPTLLHYPAQQDPGSSSTDGALCSHYTAGALGNGSSVVSYPLGFGNSLAGPSRFQQLNNPQATLHTNHNIRGSPAENPFRTSSHSPKLAGGANVRNNPVKVVAGPQAPSGNWLWPWWLSSSTSKNLSPSSSSLSPVQSQPWRHVDKFLPRSLGNINRFQKWNFRPSFGIIFSSHHMASFFFALITVHSAREAQAVSSSPI